MSHTQYTVEFDDNLIDDQSIEDIYSLRLKSSLRIHIPVGDFIEKFTYSAFCKLPEVAPRILQLEVSEVTDSFGKTTPLGTRRSSVNIKPSHLVTLSLETEDTESAKMGDVMNLLKFAGSVIKSFSGENQVFDNRHMTDFCTSVEKLAEKYNESLMVEGCSQEKALEMTLSKVVELCRKQSSSVLVKSVLTSSVFKHPKEVLSKFVKEVSQEVKEPQKLQYTANTNQNCANCRGRYNQTAQRANYRSFNGNYYNRFQRQSQPFRYNRSNNVRVMQAENVNLPSDRPEGETEN